MPERDFAGALAERMREAIASAHHAISEAHVVRATSQLIREPTSMAKRCAWCGRLAIGRGWTPAEKIPENVRAQLEDRMTHGICGGCIRRLEQEGKTAPIHGVR